MKKYIKTGLPKSKIKEWIKKGWLKKVEKKKFTKSDMIDWFIYADSHHIGCNPNIEGLFRSYLKKS